MKALLSLAPLAAVVVAFLGVWFLRDDLGDLPGVLPLAWILVLALFVGSLVTAIEAAHDRRGVS